MRSRASDMYRLLGNVVPGAKGSDWEALVNEATMYGKPGVFRGGKFFPGVEPMPLSQFKRLSPWLGDFGPVPALGSRTGVPLASKGMTKKALNLFARHDMQGTPLPITPNAAEQWLARTRLPSSVPWTSTFRAAAQTAPNLEEEYQRTAPRRKSAPFGGPRAPGEGLFNPISPSI